MLRLIWISIIFLLPSVSAYSHQTLKPLLIELLEISNHRYMMKLKMPTSLSAELFPSVQFDESCGSESIGDVYLIDCSELPGMIKLKIVYPEFNPSVPAMISYSFASGHSLHDVLDPDITEWLIPEQETASTVAVKYTYLGVTHILGGWDHLLFLLCLLMIAKTVKRILITITGFTIAHSITLIATTLEFVNVNINAVEAVIALSIVFLAAEVCRSRRDTITWKYPIAVSSSFGLIHGFGFAAVLSDIGLPQTQLVSSLLFFNLGVEIGQLIFVVAIVLFYLSFRYIGSINFTFKPSYISYGVGMIASFWLFERLLSSFI